MAASTNGKLGSWNLSAGIPQAIYVCNNEQASVVTLNVCNRGNVPALIRVAISTSATQPADAEYIEFDLELLPKAVLERTGLIISPNQYLFVKSDTALCNAVVWGIEVGEKIYFNNISANTGTTPAWVTPAGNLGTISVGLSGQQDTLTLVATDPNSSTLTYTVTSGQLPAGTQISPYGQIVNVKPTAGYTSGTSGETQTFTLSASNGTNSSSRSFTLTKKWYDGSTSALAASSALQIKNTTGTTTNGLYWINIPTIGPTQIYCDMNTDGGGWMRFALAGAPVGNSNHIVFHQFGNFETGRSYDNTSFSRFDAAMLMGAGPKSQLMWRRITDSNVILIHTMDELVNRIPKAANAGNMDLNGSGAGWPIGTMKMSITGPLGITYKTNGRYESGPAYPGIAWNSSYNDNSDNVGSFTTYLNRRSIIYWETNGPQAQNQWFHADPLQLGPSRSPTQGTSKHDIEVYFRQ
jgi:hypothetical protein